MKLPEQKTNKTTYEDTKEAFVADVYSRFGETKDEIADRNRYIAERDDFIYGDYISRALDIPIGHDFTPINWLARTVEIHKNMVMGRGFTVSSTYNTNDLSSASDENDRKRMEIENQKQKGYAESRMQLIESIKEDNGGDAFWDVLAENASAVGDTAVKMYWDEDNKKVEYCQIEAIENLYVLWNSDDFRKADAYGYIYQVSKQNAIREYGAPEDVATTPQGNPLDFVFADGGVANSPSSRPMVTIMEVTGKIEGWSSKNRQLYKVPIGKETEINVLLVGNEVIRVIDTPSKIPKYYIFPNKKQRRRAWGKSDISDGCIQLLLTYIETLSDWRTVAAKTNFPKYKALGFGPEVQTPKFETRKIQVIPLSEDQDMQELQQGDSNGLDWGRQLDEIQAQYIRESGVSRALFDDPSVTLNSNQALITSMKTTTDIAEAKKQLWAPIMKQLFMDALEMAANHLPQVKELVQPDDNWTLKVMWPSVMQKDDPQYQSMLLNRFNAGLLSPQSYMEALGESKEELDRIREAMTDPIQSAIIAHQTPLIAQALINAATAEIQAFYQAMQPSTQIQAASAQASQTPGGEGTPGINPNGGGSAPAQIATQAQNQPGQQPMSQPGTGATATSPEGAVAQTAQTGGA